MSVRRNLRGVRSTLVALALLLVAPGPAGGSSEEAVREALLAFLQTRVPSNSAVELPSLADFRLPDAAAPLEIDVSAHSRQRLEGPTPLTVSVRAGGAEIKRGVVTVSIEVRVRAWASRRRLARHATIGESDVEVVEISRSRLPRGAILEADQLVGRLTTRSIPAGGLWREDWVRDVPAVARGEQVLLRITRGPLQIEAIGRAREEASPGERVRVLNVHSRREVVGVVGEDGAVDVSF